MGMDSNGCWLGNYCMDFATGGCPAMTGLVIMTRVPMIMIPYYFTLISDIMTYVAKICSTSGSGSNDYGSNDYSGSGSSCFEAYTMVSFASISISHLVCDVQECNSTEIYCDAGMDSEGCWYGNYCINQVSNHPPLSYCFSSSFQ